MTAALLSTREACLLADARSQDLYRAVERGLLPAPTFISPKVRFWRREAVLLFREHRQHLRALRELAGESA